MRRGAGMSGNTDLPGLEQVELRRSGDRTMDFLPLMVFVAAVCAIIASVVLLALMIVMPRPLAPGAIAVLIIPMAAGVASIRLYNTSPMFDDSWRTSREGLTVARLFKRRFIDWHQVESAQTRWVNLLVGRVHVLRTAKGVVYVPADQLYLGASIKQHLNRIGKGEGIELPDRAETLWAPIPGDIPREIEWVNPQPPSATLVLALIAAGAFSIALGLWWLQATEGFRFKMVIVVAISAACIQAGLKLARTARRVNLNDERLVVGTLIGSVNTPWHQVKSTADEQGSARIRASWLHTVFLPWNTDEEGVKRLVYAIVRRLREEDRPVQLPLPEPSSPRETQS